MTADEEALLATIVAAPDDDLPRLVYADWLEEHARTADDAARAQFIRLQVDEWRDPHPWDDDPDPPASARPLAEHRDEWLAGVPADLRAAVGFERGFPASFRPADPEAAGWLGAAPELATVTRVELPGDADAFAALAGGGLLAGVRDLRLGAAGPAALAALADSPHLAGLRRLDLGSLAPDAEAAFVRFAGRSPRRALHDLALRGTSGLSADQAEQVARSPLFRAVRRLTVGPRGRPWGRPPDGPEQSDGAVALVRAAADGTAPRLTALRLGEFPRPPAGAFDGPAAGLRRLVTGRRGAAQPTYSDGFFARRHPALAGLADFVVRTYTATLFAVDLFESPHLLGLKCLDVRAPVRPALVDFLLHSDRPDALDSLYLGRDWLTHPAAAGVRDRLGPKLRTYALGSATDRRLNPGEYE